MQYLQWKTVQAGFNEQQTRGFLISLKMNRLPSNVASKLLTKPTQLPCLHCNWEHISSKAHEEAKLRKGDGKHITYMQGLK